MTTTAVQYETVIGLEVHAQLLTRSKMFCPCSSAYADSPPNTHVCPVCLGMPGVLPVINKRAVEMTVMTGLALNCSGVPLMEIVSEPDMRSPEEARAYLVKLRQILRYLDVCAGNMEEGNFPSDANVSLRLLGVSELGGKVEVKNMN